jgi:ABC-type glycerol-3-phosphate transport system permease component
MDAIAAPGGGVMGFAFRSAARPGLTAVAAILVVAWTLAPLVWLALVSVYPASSFLSSPPDLLSGGVSLGGYAALLTDPIFLDSIRNSVIAAGGTMLLCVTLAVLAGYALGRLSVPGRNVFLGGALATQMVPATVLAIPVFILVRAFGLLDSLIALVLAYSGFLLPYAVWLLRNFFEQIPRSLDAAARMDGASRLQTLRLILLPVAAPGIAATAMFVFVSCWNEFLFALVLTSQKAKTVTVRLSEVSLGLFGNYDYGVAAAAAAVAVLPVLVLFVLMNRYMVRGLLEGATKG